MLLSVRLLLFLLIISLQIRTIENKIQTITMTVSESAPIVMYNSSASSTYNQSFIDETSEYSCSISLLYTYFQTQQQLQNNSPYLIEVYGQTQQTPINTFTAYSIISPSITLLNCSQQTKICYSELRNGCPNPVSYFSYFDKLSLQVEGLELMTYNVICDQSFQTNTFEWGMLILIALSTLIISLGAIYAKAWSIGGIGFEIGIPFVVVFNVLLVIGALVAYFSLEVVNIIVLIFSWIFGSVGVGLCFNQLLFFWRIGFLRKKIFTIRTFDIRVIECISLTLGLGSVIGWWFSNRNWIVTDYIAICMTVAAIKLGKFTSLRIAVLLTAVTMTILMIFILLIEFLLHGSYSSLILNQLNNPFEFQMPSINEVYNQKCSWLPITALIYPGTVMAYMRRFDISKNTNVYLITSIIVFLFGSIIWMFVSIVSPLSWPFGLFAFAAMLGLTSFFAWKRKEIKTLWDGKFYDLEFANQEGILKITQMVKTEKRSSYISDRPDLYSGLYVTNEQSFIQPDDLKRSNPGNRDDLIRSQPGNKNKEINVGDQDLMKSSPGLRSNHSSLKNSKKKKKMKKIESIEEQSSENHR